MKNSNQLPINFEEKLMQKIRKSALDKSLFETVIIVFLSTFQLFFEILIKIFPQKNLGDLK